MEATKDWNRPIANWGQILNQFIIIINSEVEEDGKITRGQDTSWFAPQVGRSVKSELKSTDASGKAGHRVVQLTSYSLGQ